MTPSFRFDFLSLVKLNQLDGNVAIFSIIHLSIISYILFVNFFIYVLIRVNLKVFFSHSISRNYFFAILFWSSVIIIIIIFVVVIFLTFAIAKEKTYLFFFILSLSIDKSFLQSNYIERIEIQTGTIFVYYNLPSECQINLQEVRRGEVKQIGRKYFLSSNYLDNMKPKDKQRNRVISFQEIF